MYYHVIAETKSVNKEKSEKYSVLDITDKNEVIEKYVAPYVIEEDFSINGYLLNKSELKRFYISETQKTSQDLLNEFKAMHRGSAVTMVVRRIDIVQCEEAKDITQDLQKLVKEKQTAKSEIEKRSQQDMSNNIFIVHGRNDSIKNDMARFIEKLGLSATILHEQPNLGATIIEKLENSAINVAYAIVLYTADDTGALVGEKDMKSRARQNVLFEHGYFMSKLGRNKVCAVVEENVDIPSDLHGILFIHYDKGGAWKYKIAKEMKAIGINIDVNRLCSAHSF